MSHLNHIVKLNAKLIEENITSNPEDQAKIVDSAITRAIISYAYITGGVEGPNLTDHASEAMRNTVEYWNEVSPVNHRKIFEDVRAILQRLYNQAVAGGNFQPIELDIEGLEVDLLKVPEFTALHRALLNEIIAHNK
ncbi:hypothetical protein [Vibrio phage 2 TSL-2019]|uniref:Uncharacterized protein n=1 Tax=Vibrio phage 2 TSL-2019 TaxID=2508172 RepID=A0A513PWR9_9CAUD|nr:virion structural protein [Vibrio phage 2 TSL-2019]QAU04337.1 hypothetical protein [Vibrio phage 2 TSL-2019]